MSRLGFDDTNTLAEIVQRVSLPAHEKRIDIDNRLSHARDLGNKKRWDRFGYYAFPFAVPNPEFRVGLNGCHADAYKDQTGLATDAYHAARDWAYVGNGAFGVALVQRDSTLIECGKIHAPKRTFGETPATSHLYSYAFTDWLYAHAWATGPSHINLRFRYSLFSHAGAFRDARVPQLAERTVTPPLAAVIPRAQRGPLPAARHSFLSVAAPNVELLTLKLGEEPGRGAVARFHETDGAKVDGAAFKAELGKLTRLTRCTLLEQDCGALERPQLSLAPFGTFTVRFEAKGALPAAPVVSVAKATDRAVELKWPPVAGARQYHVFCGEDAGFAADEYHLAAVVSEPAYRDAERVAGETRLYRVAAVDASARQGEVSAEVAATTPAQGDAPPAKVGSRYTGLIDAPRAWRGDATDMLYLQWGQNREKDLAHYEVFRGDAPDFEVGEKTRVAQVPPGPYVTVPYEDKGLKPHTAYYYRVRAVDRAGRAGEPSDVCRGVTREPPEG